MNMAPPTPTHSLSSSRFPIKACTRKFNFGGAREGDPTQEALTHTQTHRVPKKNSREAHTHARVRVPAGQTNRRRHTQTQSAEKKHSRGSHTRPRARVRDFEEDLCEKNQSATQVIDEGPTSEREQVYILIRIYEYGAPHTHTQPQFLKVSY